MSKVFEFLLGSLLITILTIALLFFSALQYILKVGGSADCAWYSSVRAWIDSNGDGLINKGEPPLGDVEIHIDDIGNQLIDVGWPAITDQAGEVQLNVSIPGCSDTVFEIYADIPEGYRITTQPRIEVERDFWGSLGTENTYYFGFIPDSNSQDDGVTASGASAPRSSLLIAIGGLRRRRLAMTYFERLPL